MTDHDMADTTARELADPEQRVDGAERVVEPVGTAPATTPEPAAAPAEPVAAPAPASAEQHPDRWGRVDADGTVYVRTPDGERAATDLAAMVRQQQLTAIHLIGHTDNIGSYSYNDKLSLARAETVRTFLCIRLATCNSGL